MKVLLLVLQKIIYFLEKFTKFEKKLQKIKELKNQQQKIKIKK